MGSPPKSDIEDGQIARKRHRNNHLMSEMTDNNIFLHNNKVWANCQFLKWTGQFPWLRWPVLTRTITITRNTSTDNQISRLRTLGPCCLGSAKTVLRRREGWRALTSSWSCPRCWSCCSPCSSWSPWSPTPSPQLSSSSRQSGLWKNHWRLKKLWNPLRYKI